MKQFNLRVYGLWIFEQHVLISIEKVFGKEIIKFPGGGLEFGEGLKDSLKREWQEELGIPIQIGDHFYTTDYFQPSAWDDTQVISIYYRVYPQKALKVPFDNGSEKFNWHPINKELIEDLSLPIDKIIGQMLLDQLANL